MISNKLFLNYKFTREQKEAVNWQLLFVFMFMCIQFAAWNLGRNQILKSKVPYSRLCSVINTAKTTFLFQFGFLTNVFQIKSLQVNKANKSKIPYSRLWSFILYEKLCRKILYFFVCLVGWDGTVWTGANILYSALLVENMRREESRKISFR